MKVTDKVFRGAYSEACKGEELNMVDKKEVKRQLQRIGADFRFWGRPELRELPHILFDREQLEHVVNGHYTGGFAMLVATDHRVLLIDKKPLYLTLEDIRYDMISDVMFNHRLLDSSLNLGTVHKSITFTAYNPTKLRLMTAFIQQKVMEFRRQQAMQQPADQQPINYESDVARAMVVPPIQAPINPYKMPVMIRRRVSRFY